MRGPFSQINKQFRKERLAAERLEQKARQFCAKLRKEITLLKIAARRKKGRIVGSQHWRRIHFTDNQLEENIRSRIKTVLARNDISEMRETSQLIGCSLNFLHCHLQSQFTDGMSWDNYGEWEVDHKRPCALFDLNDPLQRQACFHYSNLRPLWAEDNQRRHKKIIFPSDAERLFA